MIPKRLIYKSPKLMFLDQRVLPHKISYVVVKNYNQAAEAIKNMVLRGAPLIGCGAAYGYVMGLANSRPKSWNFLLNQANKAATVIKKSRPTAMALFLAIDRLHSITLDFIPKNKKFQFNKKRFSKLIKLLEKEAGKIESEDIKSNKLISEYGASLLKKNSIVMTHCNAGALATMGMGTAVGIITCGHKKGKVKTAYACETRPYMQGARLTTWEFLKENVPVILICDDMAAHIMKTERVNAVIVGADRIAANGDTANKIGTYSLAVLAKYHKVPFYVAAPFATFDFSIKTGKSIIIEERSEQEVVSINGKLIPHKKIKARHPAFDVTPAKLINAIITEKGIIKTPTSEKIIKTFNL